MLRKSCILLLKNRITSYNVCYTKLLRGMKALQMKTNSSDYHGTQLKPARISKTGTMQRVIDIDINGISATASTEELDKNVTPIEYFQETTSQKLKSPQPGYIGTAIVYSGEKDAVGLVKKYVENSQDWIV